MSKESKSAEARAKFLKRKAEVEKRFMLEVINREMAKSSRVCGPCTACCTTFGVEDDIHKPPFVRCPHECATGCGIYPDRPDECRDFHCHWRMAAPRDNHPGPFLPDELRPDLCGVIVTLATLQGSLALSFHEIDGGDYRNVILPVVSWADVAVDHEYVQITGASGGMIAVPSREMRMMLRACGGLAEVLPSRDALIAAASDGKGVGDTDSVGQANLGLVIRGIKRRHDELCAAKEQPCN